ncbi:MAG: FxsA family protein [Hyphomicrobiales bacterium]
MSQGEKVPLFLFFLFIAVPLIEIALFIQIGSIIGLWPTLLTVIGTAVLGTWLLRQQGFAVLQQAQEASARNELPVEPIIHGVFLLIAGLLMLTPGFFTDAIGFLLLIPPLRLKIAYGIWDRIKNHVHVVTPGQGPNPGDFDGPRPGGSQGPIIDGEVMEEDDITPDERQKRLDETPWGTR